MDFQTFFDYPTRSASEAAHDLVFLGTWCQADWEILLAHTETRVFHAGEEVMRAGDDDRSLCLLTSGTLDLLLPQRVGQPKRFKSVAAPSVLGELSFVDGQPRSGTLRAVTDGELRRLSFESFEVLSARYPELGRGLLLEVGRMLSQRLRRATDYIAGAAE